ncbi:MAG: aminoglycoside phosphotransferase family protein [Holophagaceae bacterium]|nr:aminoglycoside phosphotransferase family protein [Holophagaceae bacterium]
MTIVFLEDVIKQFDILGDYVSAEPYGNGHINDTFVVVFDQGGTIVKYIVQRINDNIFTEPVRVMENIIHVTQHIRKKAEAKGIEDISRRVLTLVKTLMGEDFARDPDGHVWRCYIFIEDSKSWDIIETPSQAFEAAKAFGAFQSDLMDYDGQRLFETIPLFHHTLNRFATLQKAIQDDVKNRAIKVKSEIDFALSHEPLAGCLLSLQEKGVIPERITHNDTKLNNVLLDDKTGEGICVLDLDTVMPGLSLYDFGDMVRTATNPVAEDELDLSKVVVQTRMFEAIAKGYLEGTAGALLPVEREHLVTSGKLLTYECGIRFLTDYLQGDVYFKIKREAHNLDRCRTQFALVRSLEEHEEGLVKFVSTLS